MRTITPHNSVHATAIPFAGLVPEQKSEIPEAGETAAEGFDTNPRLPRCHDEEHLSWC